MPVFVNDNGTLRECPRAFVNDNGVLRELANIYANDNGTLRTILLRAVFLAATYNVQDVEIFPVDASITFRLNSSGVVQEVGDSTTTLDTWLRFGAAGDYESRATLLSGSITSGALNTWEALSTSRSWNLTFTGNGSATADLLIEIRRATTAQVLASSTVTLYAESAP